MNSQGQQTAITLFHNFTKQLADALRTKAQPFFLSLLCGALLAIARRRTVTTWLQAAQISEDYRQAFYHMPNIGRKSREVLEKMTDIILEQLRYAIESATHIRVVLDDTPTKRYGSKIEGAGYHHNPTPGKTDAKLCYGHSWVVAALVITHPLYGEISFPIAAELYLRKKEVDKLKAKYDRKFKKKTTMAVEMIQRLVPKLKCFGKDVEVIVDGGYANSTVLVPLGKLEGVVVITRLRCDAALFQVPPQPTKRGCGRPKTYGDRIDVKSMVESNDEWEIVECNLYGQAMEKRVKCFVARSRLTRDKTIKVVLVKENEKTWLPLISTDATMEAKEILEAYGMRFGIEEMFKDLKEVWGWGKQEVRLLESNEAVTAMNMVLFGMTELATWDREHSELVDRSYRPWDDADRRPSHADRRNFLRQAMFAEEFNAALGAKLIPQKLVSLLKRLMKLAA